MPNIRLPDPLTDPNAPGFTSVALKNSMPKYVDSMLGGRQITLESSAQQWGFTLGYDELFKEQFNILESKILESIQTGSKLEVLIPHLESYTVIGSTATCTIAQGQQGTELRIGNFNLMPPKVGDMLKLTNHSSKVYKIMSSTLSAGVLTLKVFPSLRVITKGTEKPIFNNILYELSLRDPTSWDYNYSVDGLYSSFQLELIENITDV